MGRPVWLAVAAAAVATDAVAAADEDGERVLLEYHAVEGCPDRATFEARTRSRTAHVRFVNQGQTRTFDVRIDAGPPLTGRLVVRHGDVVEGTREMHAETCPEVIDALALMVRLAIDPSAVLDMVAIPTPPEPAPPPAPLGSAPAPLVEPLQPLPAPPLPPKVDPTDSPAVEAPPAAVPARQRTLYLGADVALATSVSPRTLVGPSPYVGWRSAGEGLVEPGVRIAFVYATSGSVDAAGGTASFTWTAARADGCLLSWPPGAAHLLACARVEAGALEGAGAVVPNAQTRMRGWLAAGPLVRAEWAPLGMLFFDADVAAMLHITDDRFYFSPDATVYTVPLGGLEAAAGLGVHFL